MRAPGPRRPHHTCAIRSRHCMRPDMSWHGKASLLPVRHQPLRASASSRYADWHAGKPSSMAWKLERAKAMLAFMAPALILPLSDPLMSLIDAVCLGRFAGTEALAALGPTSVIFSFSSYVFNALGIATTTIVSKHMAAKERDGAAASATAALSLALSSSAIVFCFLQVYGARLIVATGAVTALHAPATAYLRIRAFAQPALLVSIVTQSCLLAQKDSRSPALAVAAQVVVNFTLDVFLIVFAGAGVSGAAWATVAAQYTGMLLLLRRLYATGHVRFERRLAGVRQRAAPLLKVLAPLVVVYVARNLCYMMLQLNAAALPAVKLAAHQAVWTTYTISSFATSTLEQTALAFLPQAHSGTERRSLVQVVRGMGLAMGATLGAICCGLALFAPWLFTADAAVQLQMGRIAPFVGAVMVIVGADVSAVAVLISMGYSKYLARSFVITLLAVAGFLYALSVRVGTLGLLHVWVSLIFFFAVRCVQSYLGLAMLKKSGSKQ